MDCAAVTFFARVCSNCVPELMLMCVPSSDNQSSRAVYYSCVHLIIKAASRAEYCLRVRVMELVVQCIVYVCV